MKQADCGTRQAPQAQASLSAASVITSATTTRLVGNQLRVTAGSLPNPSLVIPPTGTHELHTVDVSHELRALSGRQVHRILSEHAFTQVR